ncbi:MAG: DUF4010 domain-containing protein, partial [Flammeovirgaceae bacterium]|nr:DUF4010 domain-containing protein [Flammeovirgaceae bacterium]MDW8288511.1 DUF4010 domain-containing protein [Flammeovirgaceae bacterium]
LGFIAQKISWTILYVGIPAMLLFTTVFYYVQHPQNKGVATELSLVIVFFLGIIVAFEYFKEALAVAVLITVLLSAKTQLKNWVSAITQEELNAFIKFIILALLLLPFLPNTSYLNGVVELRNVGYVVVITSSISFIGYFIIKFFGNDKGILFTAFFGGTFSSTSVTWVYSGRSQENTTLSTQFAAGIVLACSVMFVRVLLITYVFNPTLAMLLLVPCLAMFVTGGGFVYWLIRRQDVPSISSSLPLGNPLNISNALLFGLLYIGITLFVYFSNLYLGDSGLFITSIVSGLTDVDAITISVAKLSEITVRPSIASAVIMVAMMSNTLFKMSVAWKGTKVLRTWVWKGLGSCILVGTVYILFVLWK